MRVLRRTSLLYTFDSQVFFVCASALITRALTRGCITVLAVVGNLRPMI